MKRILVAVVVLLAVPAGMASTQPSEPRFLLRLDAALLTSPNTGAGGSGGGIEIPLDGGTGATGELQVSGFLLRLGARGRW